jgi:hypothetical protein
MRKVGGMAEFMMRYETKVEGEGLAKLILDWPVRISQLLIGSGYYRKAVAPHRLRHPDLVSVKAGLHAQGNTALKYKMLGRCYSRGSTNIKKSSSHFITKSLSLFVKRKLPTCPLQTSLFASWARTAQWSQQWASVPW